MKNLFSDFSSIDKATWLKAIQNELKTSSISSLDWQLNEQIAVSPFAHREDLNTLHEPIWMERSDNSWEIAERVVVEAVETANQIALNALENGVNALIFDLPTNFKITQLPLLLNQIQHEWISTHFVISTTHHEVLLNQFVQTIAAKQQNAAQIKGSIQSSAPAIQYVPVSPQIRSALPLFCFATVDGTAYHQGKQAVAAELGSILAVANDYFQQLPIQNWHTTQFIISIDESYFLNIAKLRAFKLIWQFLLEQYEVPVPVAPIIEARLAVTSLKENMYDNMIKATTMAMSAAIGGATRIYLPPADVLVHETGTPFTKRIARNVHHLLQLESHLAHVI
ncbi:MAG: hypothetical protein HC892_17660, partial [Saprospiraceae bacterium]|nr:hypothetical protein [Saprospiraceae bacterium]